ncbi:hypothetical protein ACLOJK_029095 [Asimina triloba]
MVLQRERRAHLQVLAKVQAHLASTMELWGLEPRMLIEAGVAVRRQRWKAKLRSGGLVGVHASMCIQQCDDICCRAWTLKQYNDSYRCGIYTEELKGLEDDADDDGGTGSVLSEVEKTALLSCRTSIAALLAHAIATYKKEGHLVSVRRCVVVTVPEDPTRTHLWKEGVQIEWDAPREPVCDSYKDCNGWPNSSCTVQKADV